MSILKIGKDNFKIYFIGNMCSIHYCNEFVDMGVLADGLWILELHDCIWDINVNYYNHC